MQYTLPALPYAFDALEPYIDAKTMEIHYTKHHQAYLDNLNTVLSQNPELQSKSIEQLLIDLPTFPQGVRAAIQNHGGGYYNHSLFWLMMKKNGGGQPKGLLGQAIEKKYGSFKAMQEEFNTIAKTVFGSGWAWMCVDYAGDLLITGLPNQNNPLTDGMRPIFGLDVWEHAYYLKYQNKRVDYIAAWWHVVDWDHIEDVYKTIVR